MGLNSKIDIMLYVTDVEEHSKFWQKLGLIEQARVDLGESLQIRLATKEDSYRLNLFDIDFIEKMSPEVAAMKPSLMFFTDDFDGFIKKAEAEQIPLLEESLQGNRRTRPFQDPDGNYFVIAEKR